MLTFRRRHPKPPPQPLSQSHPRVQPISTFADPDGSRRIEDGLRCFANLALPLTGSGQKVLKIRLHDTCVQSELGQIEIPTDIDLKQDRTTIGQCNIPGL